MWNMFLIVVTLLALHRTDSIDIDPPERVRFKSTNLQNVVVWNPGMEGTHYSVEYAIYGDEDKTVEGQGLWRPVRHCTWILLNSCDLSDQTHKLDEIYYARVRAMRDSAVISNWTMTRFEPRSDTALGPPHFTLHTSGNSLDIYLKGPMRWKNKYMKKERPMKNIINEIWYNISVYDNTSRHTRHIITKNQSYQLGSLEYDTIYCVSAGTYSQNIHEESHTSEWQCEKTPTDPFKKHMLMVILAGLLPSAVSLFILILASCLVYHYIFGNKQKHPHCTSISPKEPTFAPRMAIIDVINVNIHKPSLPGDEFEKLPAILPGQLPAILPGYAVQRASPPVYNSQSWHSSGGVSEENVPLNAEAQEFDDEMPPDYGFVVHSPPEESTGRGSDPLVPPQPAVLPVTGHNSYMAQSDGRPGQSTGQSSTDEDEDQDEGGPTVIDWNPSTGVLHIPELNPMPLLGAGREVELEEDMAVPRSIFSSLVMRQESYESEDGLCKMETVWQLQINMEE
ncbi:interleukin-20 receptor subunit alpha [Alosa sapidissima]|uniref:interleukin-20 receptor subunit alpha n=1 Tax=Alosa sapidissima TaxID=34773 RepID=UPI001C08BF65|nr:interleukin-20 receptor subunit alpha [Alosa sapidissima]